jgi:hypothetical protein
VDRNNPTRVEIIMPLIESVSFDTYNFEPLPGWSDAIRTWKADDATILSLNYFLLPPDIPVSLSRLDELRRSYRDGLGNGRGLVELEVREVLGLRAVWLIFKIPQDPMGMTYVGSLTLPFHEFSYVLKVDCPEMGMTGVRDSVVFALEKQAGRMKFDSPAEFPPLGWTQDPYDPGLQSPVMRNLSDDERYDAQFPTHPLSRVRRHLTSMLSTLQVSDEIRSALKFSGPPNRRLKAWWRFW